jgi:hypothetical protein
MRRGNNKGPGAFVLKIKDSRPLLQNPVKAGTINLHSRADEVVPFADSEELVRNSGLASAALVEVRTEHRLADPDSLARMLEAVEKACESRL